jgi:hypothetical protein
VAPYTIPLSALTLLLPPSSHSPTRSNPTEYSRPGLCYCTNHTANQFGHSPEQPEARRLKTPYHQVLAAPSLSLCSSGRSAYSPVAALMTGPNPWEDYRGEGSLTGMITISPWNDLPYEDKALPDRSPAALGNTAGQVDMQAEL